MPRSASWAIRSSSRRKCATSKRSRSNPSSSDPGKTKSSRLVGVVEVRLREDAHPQLRERRRRRGSAASAPAARRAGASRRTRSCRAGGAGCRRRGGSGSRRPAPDRGCPCARRTTVTVPSMPSSDRAVERVTKVHSPSTSASARMTYTPVAVVEPADPQLLAAAREDGIQLDVDERVAVRRAVEAHLEHIPQRHRSGKDDGCRAPRHRLVLVGGVGRDRRRVRRAADAVADLGERVPQALALGRVFERRDEGDERTEPAVAVLRRPSATRRCRACTAPGSPRAAGLSRASPKVDARSNMRTPMVVRSGPSGGRGAHGLVDLREHVGRGEHERRAEWRARRPTTVSARTPSACAGSIAASVSSSAR